MDPLIGRSGPSSYAGGIGKSVPPVQSRRREATGRPQGHKPTDATLPRKTSKESGGKPYRNPTQVDKEKILRRSSEAMRRNSAN